MSMPPPPQHPQTPAAGYGPLGQHGPHGPHQGPPPGYAGQPTQQMPQQPPGQTTQPPSQPPQYGGSAPQHPAAKAVQLVWTLGLVSVAAVVLGLSLKEDGRNQWDTVHAWGGLAIAGAILTLAPAFGRSVGLTPQRAWQAATCGAGALVLFWVLFTLPSVGSNMSLVTTIGVAAGVIAAWVAPGREDAPAGPQRPTW
jgi:hypothetical protein